MNIARKLGWILLGIIGWIFIPYILIFIYKKRMRDYQYGLGFIWSIVGGFFLLIGIISLRANNSGDTSITATTTTTINSTDTANADKQAQAQAAADAKAKAQAEADAKAKAEAKAKADAAAKAKAEKIKIESEPHLNEVGKVGNLSVLIGYPIQKQPLYGGGEWWDVTVAIMNNGKNPVTVDSNMFELFGPDGSKYEPDTMATLDANPAGVLAYQTLNPGMKTYGSIVFDMPGGENTSDFTMRVNGGAGFFDLSTTDFIMQLRAKPSK